MWNYAILTASNHRSDKTVSIPNREVAQEYVNAISTMDWGEVMRSVDKSAVVIEKMIL